MNITKPMIFIVNGMAGAGKDTFFKILRRYYTVYKYSSIDAIKDIARMCGWNGKKTERDRKFLSDLKCLISEYSDLPFMTIKNFVRNYSRCFDLVILLIDVREPEEIERAKQKFNAKTILIKNDRVPHITSNMADARVYDYEYDYVIENNGTIEEFEANIQRWACKAIKEELHIE